MKASKTTISKTHVQIPESKKNPRGVGSKQGYALNESRNKTESDMNALFTTQCGLQSAKKGNISINSEALGALKRQCKTSWIIAMMCKESGCRVSEALQAWGTDINKSGRWLIRSKKKGKNRIVNLSNQIIDNLHGVGRPVELFGHTNRFYVYRQFKKAGIILELDGYERARVTHAFRHEYANQLQELTKDERVIADGMGHKSNESQKSYIRHE